jgi:hypothetical protein
MDRLCVQRLRLGGCTWDTFQLGKLPACLQCSFQIKCCDAMKENTSEPNIQQVSRCLHTALFEYADTATKTTAAPETQEHQR